MKQRHYDLVIYFQDSPTPLYLEGVRHITTQGAMLKVVCNDWKNQWWPLCNIFNIREIDKRVVEE